MLQVIFGGTIESIPHREERMADAKLQTVVDHGCNIRRPSPPIHPMALMEDHECLFKHPMIRVPKRNF